MTDLERAQAQQRADKGERALATAQAEHGERIRARQAGVDYVPPWRRAAKRAKSVEKAGRAQDRGRRLMLRDIRA